MFSYVVVVWRNYGGFYREQKVDAIHVSVSSHSKYSRKQIGVYKCISKLSEPLDRDADRTPVSPVLFPSVVDADSTVESKSRLLGSVTIMKNVGHG